VLLADSRSATSGLLPSRPLESLPLVLVALARLSRPLACRPVLESPEPQLVSPVWPPSSEEAGYWPSVTQVEA
jgi:hypothetical protein